MIDTNTKSSPTTHCQLQTTSLAPAYERLEELSIRLELLPNLLGRPQSHYRRASMASQWFPVGKGGENGWRLDIVSLLAVIGESSMESHSQALTSSWTCILPRIIPAPQALLKATRPSRLRMYSNFESLLSLL